MTDSIRLAASEFALDLNVWAQFFTERVKAHKLLVRGYLSYVSEMQGRNLPPIFEGRHLGLLLGLSATELARYTFDPDSCYRNFDIPKRSGGVRSISSPWAKLLSSQQWIDWYILRQLPVHDSSYGYVRGRSNVCNAAQHLGARSVLCLDIKDFFGSIGFEKVIEIFHDVGYPHNVSFLLARLCTRFGFLPQGAASSPQLSNIIMFNVDERLTRECSARGYRYTRYVDDITISGDDLTRAFADEVSAAISILGLFINDSKTRLQIGRKKIVTGISIGSGALKLPRKMRRRFKNDAFLSLKRLRSQDRSEVETDALCLDRQLGQLAYWKSVERTNEAVSAMLAELQTEMRNTPK